MPEYPKNKSTSTDNRCRTTTHTHTLGGSSKEFETASDNTCLLGGVSIREDRVGGLRCPDLQIKTLSVSRSSARTELHLIWYETEDMCSHRAPWIMYGLKVNRARLTSASSDHPLFRLMFGLFWFYENIQTKLIERNKPLMKPFIGLKIPVVSWRGNMWGGCLVDISAVSMWLFVVHKLRQCSHIITI